jgi:hypothetical protein
LTHARTPDQHNGIAALVHGDPQRARELRADLAVFARRSDNPNLRRQVADVLAGRRNVREVLRTPEFNNAAAAALGNIEDGLAQLTDEQRAQVWDRTRPRTQESNLDAMRDAYDPGGSLAPEPPLEPESNEHRGPIKISPSDDATPAPPSPVAPKPRTSPVPSSPSAAPVRARRPRPAIDDDDDGPRETFLKRSW